MRIAYCTNVRLPSERAHGHQIASVCKALHQLGHSVSIFAPYRDNCIATDFWSYYRLPSAIRLKYLGFFDPIKSALFPGVIGLWVMNAFLRRSLKKIVREHLYDLYYTRSPALLSALLSARSPVVLELHQLPRRGRSSFVRACNACRAVVCLTHSMARTLCQWGVDPQKVIVEGDAVDLDNFLSVPTQEEARKKFNVCTDRTVVGYVGRLKTLGMDKGVSLLLQALAQDKRFYGFIVGGPEADCSYYQTMAAQLGLTNVDVMFTGEISAEAVPSALVVADVLVMPFPNKKHYRENMSPLKMFEYMASGKPIITSNLPTIRDVLSEETAYFFTPDSLEEFLTCLSFLLQDPHAALAKALAAKHLVLNYSWLKRMQRILDELSKLDSDSQ